MSRQRIVSLLASSTEIVYALGRGDQLVGRSHECDYPRQVLQLPVCTRPKFAVDGTSKDIDERVKATLQSSPEDALSVYAVDAGLLDKLRPDVILTQSQCEVCAVSLKDVERALCSLVSSAPTIVSLEPHFLEDVWNDIRQVASAIDAITEGEKLIEEMTRRLGAVSDQAATRPAPSVACIEWIEPLMAAGNWMPELVRIAGGNNLFGVAGRHSPWMRWEELYSKDPDVLVVAPCGFDMERTGKEMFWLTRRPRWKDLNAVRNRRVCITDGNQYFNRPGPRLVDSTEILAEMFFPGHVSFGREKTHWQVV